MSDQFDGIPESFKEETMDRLQEHQRETLKKYGFYIHLVADNEYQEINAHTHGLAENYNHVDFQIVLNLHPQVISSIFHNICDLVKSGEKFHDGQSVPGIIKNFNVKLFETTESNRKVLRIILPDKKGNLDEDAMEELYAEQYIV